MGLERAIPPTLTIYPNNLVTTAAGLGQFMPIELDRRRMGSRSNRWSILAALEVQIQAVINRPDSSAPSISAVSSD
ncbi:hypothetical protein [Nocardia sp. AB354]|uniref:hypothetical protein n=1 Tax=Nocardia sp. AB354 TaxID=3413283 RepID=UPI003C1A006C